MMRVRLQRAEYRCARTIISRSSHPACTARPVHTKVHGEAEAAAIARMEDLSSQSYRRHRVDVIRLSSPRSHSDCYMDYWFSNIVAVCPMVRCNRASECRTDRSPAHRGIRLGADT